MTTYDRAALAEFNRGVERARREYQANPLVTNRRPAATSEGRTFRVCANDCGQTTRARGRICLACRKGNR